MKKIFNLSFIFLVGMLMNNSASAQLLNCGTDEMHIQMLKVHPELAERQRLFDSILHRVQFQRSDTDSVIPVYIIPIVFHVIHNYGEENISDEQIYDQVRILNEDYRKLNADTNVIIPKFRPIAADAHIEFRLANLDPNGNCTNGIDRIQSLRTYFGGEDSKLNPWPRDNYLNIWSVATLGRPGSEVAGYAHFPSDVPGLGALVDGVIILYNYVGSIGAADPGKSRAITHEIGHCLSLSHPWGRTNANGEACGDDGIDDTPQTAGSFPTGYCNLNLAQCTPGPNPPAIIENVQNFMDYSYCSKMFTRDQVKAMRTTLESNEANRDSLWTNANHIFTGTNYEYVGDPKDLSTYIPPIVCHPVADFFTPSQLVCMDDDVVFKNVSWRGAVTNSEWTFDANTTPPTSTDSNISVTFNTTGWHSVSLKVSNQNGVDTLLKSNYVYVSSGVADRSAPFFDGFEDAEDFASDWIVINSGNNKSKWQLTSSAHESASGVFLNNFGNDFRDFDEMVSPAVDLSAADQPQYMSFLYSSTTSATSVAGMLDTLRLQYSSDCGRTWVNMALLRGPELANNGFSWESYVPVNSSIWSAYNVTLPAGALKSNVRFKFQFRSSGVGNNVYIDNFNIADTMQVVGIDDPASVGTNFSLYPNPSASSVELVWQLAKESSVKIELYDALGRMIDRISDGKQAGGNHQLTINSDGQLPDGVYIVRLTADNQTVSKRLVITR